MDWEKLFPSVGGRRQEGVLRVYRRRSRNLLDRHLQGPLWCNWLLWRFSPTPPRSLDRRKDPRGQRRILLSTFDITAKDDFYLLVPSHSDRDTATQHALCSSPPPPCSESAVSSEACEEWDGTHSPLSSFVSRVTSRVTDRLIESFAGSPPIPSTVCRCGDNRPGAEHPFLHILLPTRCRNLQFRPKQEVIRF
jgi:hypothetical protein